MTVAIDFVSGSSPVISTSTPVLEIQKQTTDIAQYNPETEKLEEEEINFIQVKPHISLPKALHNLIQRIFDPNALAMALKGMRLDFEKLSVEQLTQDQISAGRRILKELAQVSFFKLLFFLKLYQGKKTENI